MKKVLLYLWQLPQNLLALALMGVLHIFHGKPEKSEYKGIQYRYYKKWYNGVSLGNYVLLADFYTDNLTTINHEYGHTRQSLYFGPLYLLIIGLPSATGNLIDRILGATCKSWTYERSYKWYYNLPWEKGADKLGGVKRWTNS